jgi:hypothetical protein
VDSKLAVTFVPDSGPASVRVLSMDGQVLQSITADRDRQMLQEPQYITSTPGGESGSAKLYVTVLTDRGANSIHDTMLCYTLDGRCLFKYRI